MARCIRLLPATLAVLCLSLFLPTQARAEERYFIIVFGSQSNPIHANLTHTWATVVKVANMSAWGPCSGVEWYTISWLPATLKVNTLAVLPEKGANLDLHTTLQVVLATEQEVAFWGPYEINLEMFQCVLAQKARLESGIVRYKAIDYLYNPENRSVSNCIHAVSDANCPHDRMDVVQLIRYGEAASEQIVNALAEHGRIDPRFTHSWVIPLVGLNWYPAVQRSVKAPH